MNNGDFPILNYKKLFNLGGFVMLCLEIGGIPNWLNTEFGDNRTGPVKQWQKPWFVFQWGFNHGV